MAPLRAAIIGCGLYGRAHAARLLSIPDEVRLVAFYDHKSENAMAYSQEFGGAAIYTDTARLFAEMDLNLVYICLPPFAHTDEVELACRYGVHFLIEKPIALTLERAQAMAALVQAGGVRTQVGFQFRHGEAVQWLKRYITGQDASSVQRRGAEGLNPSAGEQQTSSLLHRDADDLVSSATGQGVAERAFMTARYACNSLHRWWWRDRSRSGGQVFEQITHILDLARYLLGEPAQVFSVQDNLFHRDVPDYTVEDASATTIRFRSGALANVAATNGAIPGRWDSDWRVVLPHVTADFSSANNATIHHTDRLPPTATTIASDRDLVMAQTLDLLAAIRDNRPTVCPIDEGVRSLQLGLAAMHSAETGLPVDMPMA
jgi:predicted dehydrogenase